MTSKIITVFNQKGGAGKTTTSMNIAGTLGIRGFKVMVVDMDDQATAGKWASQAEDDKLFPAAVVNLNHMDEKMHREIKNYIDDYDFIVIDCPPGKKSRIPDSAMKVSDLAIIPLSLTPADMWATQAARDIALEAKEFNPDLQIRYLVNNYKGNRTLGKEALDVLEQDKDVQMFGVKIGDRVAFQMSMLNGETVHAMTGQEKAIFEINRLADEVLDILGVKTGAKHVKTGK